MEGFARLVLTVAIFALVVCASMAGVFWLLSVGERRPEIAPFYWFTVAVAGIFGAALCAWCVSMLDVRQDVQTIRELLEKEARDRAIR